MNRLLTPFLYLRVRHPVKWWYDIGYPAIFAGVVGSIINLWPLQFNVLGDRGLVETFNGLLGILIGFFIAALAAVATFDRPGMDSIMRGEAATIRPPGRTDDVPLTRRMYLCLLFGYLTLVTLIAFVGFSLANVMLTRVEAASFGKPELYGIGRAIFIYVFWFVLGHILSNSLLGVHYLAWRAVIVDPAASDPDQGQH